MVQVRRILILLSWSLPQLLLGQIGNVVFDDQIMHQITIHTPLENWFEVLESDYALNAQDPNQYPEIYRPCSVSLDGNLIVNSGFREKGNFSNVVNVGARKKPLKIAFDAVVEQSFNGVKKINLHNFTNDPSLIHDALAYSIFRELGIPAPRTAYAQVWVNGEYIGVYLMVENVDKTFLKIHYGSQNNDGNLYKTDREAKVLFNDLGNDASAYIDAGLKLTTNEEANDYSKVIDFVHFLNQQERQDFDAEFKKRFDVERYLKILAVEKFIRSWDNYWNGGNNFYLYEHPDGQYRWIPWDMNETFQDVRNLSWTTWLDGYWIPYKQMDERPLIAAIFQNQQWKEDYLEVGCELIHQQLTIQNLSSRVVFWHNLVADAYQNDPNKLNTYEDFEKSLTEQHRDQIQLFDLPYALRFHYPGLLPLIQSQREWVARQLEGWEMECSIEQDVFHLQPFPNPGSSYFSVKLPDGQRGQVGRWQVVNEQGIVVQSYPWMVMVDTQWNAMVEDWSTGIYFIHFEGIDGSKGVGKWMRYQEN